MPQCKVLISVTVAATVDIDEDDDLEDYLYDEAPELINSIARRGDYTFAVIDTETPVTS